MSHSDATGRNSSQPRTYATFDDLLAEIRHHRWWLAVWCLVPAAVAVVYSLSATPVYEATVVVKVAKDPLGTLDSSMVPGQLSGLASLAGFRLGGSDESVEAVAVLRSNELARSFVSEQDRRIQLFPDKWDAANKRWRTKKPDGPSLNDTVERFLNTVRRVKQDNLTGLVEVEFRWRDRELAAAWANDYVRLANARLSLRKMQEARKMLAYLEKTLTTTDNVQLQEVVARLMQTQINNATLANVRDDYAFRVVDPAFAPDEDDYVWPRPALLVVVSAVIGLIFGLLTAQFRRHGGKRPGSGATES